MGLAFRTKCHPEANGRKPKVGEQQWTFTFDLEGGQKLIILSGKEGRDAFKSMLEQEEIDDLAHSNPKDN